MNHYQRERSIECDYDMLKSLKKSDLCLSCVTPDSANSQVLLMSKSSRLSRKFVHKKRPKSQNELKVNCNFNADLNKNECFDNTPSHSLFNKKHPNITLNRFKQDKFYLISPCSIPFQHKKKSVNKFSNPPSPNITKKNEKKINNLPESSFYKKRNQFFGHKRINTDKKSQVGFQSNVLRSRRKKLLFFFKFRFLRKKKKLADDFLISNVDNHDVDHESRNILYQRAELNVKGYLNEIDLLIGKRSSKNNVFIDYNEFTNFSSHGSKISQQESNLDISSKKRGSDELFEYNFDVDISLKSVKKKKVSPTKNFKKGLDNTQKQGIEFLNSDFIKYSQFKFLTQEQKVEQYQSILNERCNLEKRNSLLSDRLSKLVAINSDCKKKISELKNELSDYEFQLAKLKNECFEKDELILRSLFYNEKYLNKTSILEQKKFEYNKSIISLENLKSRYFNYTNYLGLIEQYYINDQMNKNKVIIDFVNENS